MSKLLAFMKLDFITVKPYLTAKHLLVMLGVALLMSINDTTNSIVLGFLMMFALLYSSYPFAVGEKNTIDALYMTLPLDTRSIVLGRYGFVLALNAAGCVVSFSLSFIMQTVMQRTFDPVETLFTILVLFAIYTIFQAFQLPVYFKLGYAKAKFIASLPLAIIPLVITLSLGAVFSDYEIKEMLTAALNWIVGNAALVSVTGITLWLLIMFSSYKLSLRFYSNREF